MQKRKKKKRVGTRKKPDYDRRIYVKIRIAGILFGVLLLCGGVYWLLENYSVTGVNVEGNQHYTKEQIQDIVLSGPLSNNSLVLSLRYRNKSITDVPFVERMDVSIVDRHNVLITVYEKSLAGYVEYLGNYMYFDKDGIVVESSKVTTAGIPLVTGLKFDYIVLHEPLPVANEDVFSDILDMTQLLKKYELQADRIYFDSSYRMTIYFDDVKVALGESDNLDEKMMQLKHILPELAGKSGILHMENYAEGSKNTTFAYD